MQITDDLDIGLAVAGLEVPFRAYSRLGQRATVVVTVQNPGAARSVALEVAALAEGWRLTPAAVVVDVAAGGQVAVPVVVELPPMQSRVTDPQLRVMARSGGQRTAVTLPVAVDAAAAERGAHLYRVAPDGLLGGLNPLHYGLGARRFSATSAATAFPCQGPPDV